MKGFFTRPVLTSVSSIWTGVAVAATLHLSPKQMAESWEAFSLNRNLTALDDHSFKSYKQALIKDAENVVIDDNLNTGAVVSALGKRSGGLPSVTPPAKRFNVQFNDEAAASAVDSVAGGRRVSMSPAPPGGLKAPAPNLPKYDKRENAGKVIATFDPQKLESVQQAKPRSSPKCTISYSYEANVQKPYRHMFTTLEERAQALDQHLVELGDAMMERYGLGREEEGNETGIAGLEAVGVPRQEKVCCIGRICNAVSLKTMEVPQDVVRDFLTTSLYILPGARRSNQCDFGLTGRFSSPLERGAH